MQKKRFKIYGVAVMVLLAAALLAGCGAPALPRPTPSAGAAPVRVSGSCEITVGDGVITVSGETDIMDGALMHVSVVSQAGMIVDSVTFTKNGDTVSKDFSITPAKYDETVQKVAGYITCAPSLYGAQPQSVYDAYGKKFENIDSGFVWNNDGVVVLFGSKIVDLPGIGE